MEEQIEKRFATPDGCELEVENIRGEITVEGWDQPSTEVIAIRRKGKADIEITQDGRKVIARTKHEHNGFFWLDWLTKGSAPVVDYAVRVPFASTVKLKNVNGTIKASDLEGAVHVNNVDGTAMLRAIKGQVQAETVNGSLQAEALEGTAHLKTVNGQMKVSGNTLDHLNADTVNGDIEVTAALAGEGNYAFHTVNGSCHLTVQPGFSARVSAHGVNMSVDCQLPSQSVERRFGNWEGTIGTGDGSLATIHFSTVNGRLRLDHGATDVAASTTPFAAKSQSPKPPAAPQPPEPSAPDADIAQAKVAEPPAPQHTTAGKSQSEVLQMVERGEIGVDEAIELLKEAK